MRLVLTSFALGLIMMLGAACTALAQELPEAVPDREAYQLVFDDDFSSIATIAETPAADPSAKWFRSFYFGHPTSAEDAFSVEDGVLHMQAEEGHGSQLVTAAPADNEGGWAGSVFRNGAYFEARIAIGPDNLEDFRYHPAFWLMSVEHMAQRDAALWPGQGEGFMRLIESDIMEYSPRWGTGQYIATINEWYGRWDTCRERQWCLESNRHDDRRTVRLNPPGRIHEFRVYGQLWVPATEETPGYIQNFLDGQPVGVRIEWQAGEPTPPAEPPLLYNVMDRHGMVLILTTGAQRMSVDWVRVWQRPEGVVERR